MTSPDERISAALDSDDRAFLDQLESDRGLFTQIGDSWHGPLAGWAKLVFATAIIVGLTLAYTFYLAVTAQTTDAMIGWGMTTIGLLILQGFIKEWMFNRMNMISVLIEVKRLQVQVALLSEKKA
ncbi:MAG: DUF6768 family protein [Pseudomonadota bacterium]